MASYFPTCFDMEGGKFTWICGGFFVPFCGLGLWMFASIFAIGLVILTLVCVPDFFTVVVMFSVLSDFGLTFVLGSAGRIRTCGL